MALEKQTWRRSRRVCAEVVTIQRVTEIDPRASGPDHFVMDDKVNKAAILAASISRRSVFAAPGIRQTLHRHDTPRLILYLDGDMCEEAFEGETRLVRGDYLFRPAHFAHANIADRAGARYIGLRVSDTAVRRWVRTNGWRAAYGRATFDQSFSGDELLDTARPLDFAAAPLTGMRSAAARIAAGDDTRVCDIARSMGLRAYELTRRFAAAFGVTPSAYRRQARLQRALCMLSEGSASLAQVAAAAGFHDQSHLSIALRRETGMTPGEARRCYA